MDIPQELKGVLRRDPEVMGGDVCFTGIRIPFVVLLDNIAAGTPRGELHEGYPSLIPERVPSVLDWANPHPREAPILAA